MAAKHEMNSIYASCYTQLLTMLKASKPETPEVYAAMADLVREYREWIALVSGIASLPEVPSN